MSEFTPTGSQAKKSTSGALYGNGVRARRPCHRNDNVGDREPVERPFDRALAGAVQLPMDPLAFEVAGEVEGEASSGNRGFYRAHVDVCR